MNSECLIASLPSFAVGKTFPSWTGSLSSVALDELTPELESTSLLVCWQGRKRKALAWGRKRAKELKCFSFLLSPLGSEIDYYDILTFLLDTGAHTGLSLAAGVVIRKLKGLHVGRQEANCLMQDVLSVCTVCNFCCCGTSQSKQWSLDDV